MASASIFCENELGDDPGAIRQSSGGDRAQSGVIGYVLVIGMIVAGMVMVVVLGASAIGDIQQQANGQRVEHTMTLFDSRAALVALGSADSQTIPLPATGGTYYTDDSAGWMRVNVTNTTTGDTETIANVSLGAIKYETGDTVIAYQGGGVWRQDGDNQSRMISPPEFHYRDATLTLPIIGVDGGISVTGGSLSVQRNGTVEQIYPNASAGDVNPVKNGEVTVTVRSEYYQGWADYFEDRTQGDADTSHRRDIANITLTVPNNGGTVSGGVVSGSSGTVLEVDNNAEADSYNSSNGDYSTTESTDTDIIVAGDLTVYNNGIVDGDLEAGGDVDLQNNAEVHGNISYGGSYSAHHTATVDGWTASNSTVSVPNSVAGLIDDKVGTVKDSNDNASESTDIDDIENEECGSQADDTCDLPAGQYYLNQIDMEETLELDTTGGDITLVVDGDVDFGNGAHVDVVGSNRVNVYTESDVDFDNNAHVTVPGDRAPNFWIYMNPATSIDIGQNVVMDGVIYGPGSATTSGVDISFENDAHVYGAVVGDVGNLDNNFNIHYDEALANADAISTNDDIPIVTYLHISSNRVNVSSE